MAEMEQAHRHNGDAHMLEADKSVIQRGHWLGFATTIAAIIAASATALMGAHWAVSVAMVSLPVTAIVKELINRKR